MRLAIDTGGTFTDVVLADETGRLRLEKALTRLRRPFEGIEEALGRHAAARRETVADLLGQVQLVVYGTTAATNAIVTKSAARTALVTTEGFADTMALREGGKRDAFDFSRRFPPPYIPRRLTFEVKERISAEGEVLTPLDEEQACTVLRSLREHDVEAVAVSLLWSIAEPAHELRLGELLDRELPGVPYTLSHRLNPVLREYRRSSGAAIDASLKPLMDVHFEALHDDLEATGFRGNLLVVTCMGGGQLLDEIRQQPIYAVNSGPAMAPVGARRSTAPAADALVVDVGGTTFDVSLLRDGEPVLTRDSWLGERFEGDITGLPSVDVRSIGAGGGSVAHVDSGGLLRVGPQSAGADPGPACYGRGGERPTLSDAALLLGYLDPDYFLGGAMQLDVEAARVAVERDVAVPLGLSVERAAYSIFALANVQMATLARDFVIYHGVDPRTTTLVAGGGAGGMLAADIAAALGCSEVIVPRTAAALSASGGLSADIVREFAISRYLHTDHFDVGEANAALDELDEAGKAFLADVGRHGTATWARLLVEARYPSQAWEIEVKLPVERFRGENDVAALVDAFATEHERLFGVRQDGYGVECVNWKLRCGVVLPATEMLPADGDDERRGAVAQEVQAYFEDGVTTTPRLRPEALDPGEEIAGPLIVSEPETALVVPPGWRLCLLESAAYRLSKAEGSR